MQAASKESKRIFLSQMKHMSIERERDPTSASSTESTKPRSPFTTEVEEMQTRRILGDNFDKSVLERIMKILLWASHILIQHIQ